MTNVRPIDLPTEQWLNALAASGGARAAAEKSLHEFLLRVARAEAFRRGPQFSISGPELDDLAHHAAADALVRIIAKVNEFRGDSRFTTWACKFVMFEVSSKLARHFWRHAEVRLDAQAWDSLPSRFGLDPARESEWRDLADALRHAVEHDLTDHQRRIFVAIVVDGVPLDALVAELATNRNAVYKTVFDARRKLRTVLQAKGFLDAGLDHGHAAGEVNR